MADGTAGDFTLTAGKWYGDAEADKGIQTGPDSRFFALYSEMEKKFDNKGKDLVLQVSSSSAQPFRLTPLNAPQQHALLPLSFAVLRQA